MNGVILVDKPQGVTSFDVVRHLRRWCKTRQVGHCGTLDPLASGLLPVTVGTATRLVEYLMADEKEYLASLCLGTATDTQDSTGKVLSTHPWTGIEPSAFVAACQSFVGTFDQLPPMYSALKQGGIALYRLARQGLEVERRPRPVTISQIEVLEFTAPVATLRVVCGKGTYIRTLCHDIGERLGCGAHLSALRRLRCGALTVDEAHPLAELQSLAEEGGEIPLLSPAVALANWPVFTVHPAALKRLANGVAPSLAEVSGEADLPVGTLVKLQADGCLVAIAGFAPGGEGGRPGDFALRKVFPEIVSSP